jgi:membrane protease YdiL (CAAX protease family)
VQEGLAVWSCYLAGAVLFKGLQTGRIPAFRPPAAAVARSLALGVVLALPLAVVNNLYFYTTTGALRFQDPLSSALEALKPGIAEEVVWRYFILALCFTLLKDSPRRRLATAAAVALAVVPHSLNHLPDLFLQNPIMGLVMLLLTSLLFGLPMALLQVRRNLETSIAFHWLIDFARFWFGF